MTDSDSVDTENEVAAVDWLNNLMDVQTLVVAFLLVAGVQLVGWASETVLLGFTGLVPAGVVVGWFAHEDGYFDGMTEAALAGAVTTTALVYLLGIAFLSIPISRWFVGMVTAGLGSAAVTAGGAFGANVFLIVFPNRDDGDENGGE